MQVYPVLLLALVNRLPESPRFYAMNDQEDEAKRSLERIYGEGDDAKKQLEELMKSAKDEGGSSSYAEMLTPSNDLFHPSMITIMGQVNQALTGYGAVSVYGPQIFEVRITSISSTSSSETKLTHQNQKAPRLPH